MLARFISIDICCAPGHVFPRSNNKFEKTLRFFDCTGQERTTSAGTTAAATTTESGGTTTTLPPIIITTNAPDDCPPADGCAEDKPNMDCPASKVPRIERGPDPTSSILYDRCCSQIVCEDETTTTTEPPQTTTVVTSTTTSPVPTTTASPDPPPDPFDPHRAVCVSSVSVLEEMMEQMRAVKDIYICFKDILFFYVNLHIYTHESSKYRRGSPLLKRKNAAWFNGNTGSGGAGGQTGAA